jgi:Ca2+-binding RTX toxin-like protein
VGNVGGDNLQGEAGDDFIDEASAVDAKFETTTTPPDTFTGVDTIHGGVGFNTCDFNRGLNPVTTTNYTLCFSTTTSGCTGSQADGADGDDVTNCSHIKLDGGADNVTGSVGDDTVEAGDGDDVLNGGSGNDTLYGEGGDDTVNGGAGFDMLDGGADQTAGVLDGGAEDDICVSPAAVPTVSCEQ